MAQVETEFNPSSWVEPTRNGAEIATLEDAAPTSLAGLAAALQTANGAYYTDERLNGMTKNDMRYAYRLEVAGLTP